MYILFILDDVSAYCLLSLGEAPFGKGASPAFRQAQLAEMLPPPRKLSQIGFTVVFYLWTEVGFVLVDWTTEARRLAVTPKGVTAGAPLPNRRLCLWETV